MEQDRPTKDHSGVGVFRQWLDTLDRDPKFLDKLLDNWTQLADKADTSERSLNALGKATDILTMWCDQQKTVRIDPTPLSRYQVAAISRQHGDEGLPGVTDEAFERLFAEALIVLKRIRFSVWMVLAKGEVVLNDTDRDVLKCIREKGPIPAAAIRLAFEQDFEKVISEQHVRRIISDKLKYLGVEHVPDGYVHVEAKK